ncbi:MAG: recombinase family protein [Burkholderiaceae bacterium]|nr:recombinase family protein [Burkholderiaceae bacterium]
MLIGYARVSTQDQDPEMQLRALTVAGVQKLVHEYRSGAGVRPELDKLLKKLNPGDVLIVYKIDRLARSLADLLRVLAEVTAAGASFKSLTEPIDTTTPAGRMLIQLLGSFAEFERAIIIERCSAGRAVAVQRGVRFGRPRSLTESQLVEVQLMNDEGFTVTEIARKYGCHPDTVRRALGRR